VALSLNIKLKYIYSFIMSICIAPLQGDHSEALPIPVLLKRKILDERKKRVIAYIYIYNIYIHIYIYIYKRGYIYI